MDEHHVCFIILHCIALTPTHDERTLVFRDWVRW